MPVFSERTEARIDDFQETLPPIPAAVLKLQRSVARETCSAMTQGFSALSDSSSSIFQRASQATRTVTGTAKWGAGRAARAATVAAKTVAGQAEAQARIVGEVVSDEAESFADDARSALAEVRDTVADVVEAVDGVVGSDGTPTGEILADLTKDELYRRAKAADIDGRSSMSKPELIDALAGQ